MIAWWRLIVEIPVVAIVTASVVFSAAWIHENALDILEEVTQHE